MWNYTKAVHDHFLHPHNVGPLEGANAIGEVGSLTCGDALKLYLKINDPLEQSTNKRCIRFANKGNMWNAELGANLLGSTTIK